MAYSLLRSHRICVNSENRDPNDTPYNFRMEMPNNLISLSDPATQRIKISLMQFSCDCMWFEINARNNGIVFKNNVSNVSTSIIIPEGNYTFQRLALTITHLYPECTCQWVQETNKLVFSFTDIHTLSFVAQSYEPLGFDEGDSGVNGLTITSSVPMKTRTNSMIYIRLNDVIQANECINLDNMTSLHGNPSNILCSIPVNASPYQTIYYDNSVYGRDMGIFLSSPKLNYLTINMTDKYGNDIDYLTDWTAQFLIEIFDIEDNAQVDMVSLLRNMDDTLQKLLLYKFIK